MGVLAGGRSLVFLGLAWLRTLAGAAGRPDLSSPHLWLVLPDEAPAAEAVHAAAPAIPDPDVADRPPPSTVPIILETGFLADWSRVGPVHHDLGPGASLPALWLGPDETRRFDRRGLGHELTGLALESPLFDLFTDDDAFPVWQLGAGARPDLVFV